MNAGSGTLISLRNGLAKRVVELQRNAEQERSERRRSGSRGSPAAAARRVRAASRTLNGAPGGLGRRVRQRERVRRHHDRCAGGDPQRRAPARRHAAPCPTRMPATIQPIVPSTRMIGKVARRVRHVVEGDGVRERQRRHVAQRVQNEQRIERREARLQSTRSHMSAAAERGAAARAAFRSRRTDRRRCP